MNWTYYPGEASVRVYIGDTPTFDTVSRWTEPFVLCITAHDNFVGPKDWYHSTRAGHNVALRMNAAPNTHYAMHFGKNYKELPDTKNFFSDVVIREPVTDIRHTDWNKVGYEIGLV